MLNIQFKKDKKDEIKDLGVSDKLTLVVGVARKVQNHLAKFCDAAEKIKK